MRVMTLGRLGAAIQSDVPALRGDRAALRGLFMVTMLRTALLLPGVYLAGGRGSRAWLGAGVGAITLTSFSLLWQALQGRRNRETAAAVPAGISPPVDNFVDATAEPVVS